MALISKPQVLIDKLKEGRDVLDPVAQDLLSQGLEGLADEVGKIVAKLDDLSVFAGEILRIGKQTDLFPDGKPKTEKAGLFPKGPFKDKVKKEFKRRGIPVVESPKT